MSTITMTAPKPGKGKGNKGPLATTGAKTDKPLLVRYPIGPYPVGMSLDTVRSVADYGRQLVTLVQGEIKAGGNPEMVATIDALVAKLAPVTDTALAAVLVTTDTETALADGEDWRDRYIDVLQEAGFTVHRDPPNPDAPDAAITNTERLARTLGGLVSEETEAGMAKAVEASRDERAGFPELARNLIRDLGHIGSDGKAIVGAKPGYLHPKCGMLLLPQIGTKNTGSAKSDRAPYGYSPASRTDNGPDGKPLPRWNGDYARYKRGDATVDVVDLFVGAEDGAKGGHYWALRINQIKGLIAETPLVNTAPDLLAIANATGGAAKLADELREARYEYNRRKTLHSKALLYIQRKAQWSIRFSGRLDIDWANPNGNLSQEARLTAPFVLVEYKDETYTDPTTGEIKTHRKRYESVKRYSFTAIAGIEPRKYPPEATLATVTAKAKRKSAEDKAKGEAPAAVAVPTVKTSDQLSDFMSAMSHYLDNGDNAGNIMRRIGQPGGDAVASNICRTFAALRAYAEDADVMRAAASFDKRQMKANLLKQEADAAAKGE